MVPHSIQKIALPTSLVNLTVLELGYSTKFDWRQFGQTVSTLPLTRLQCALLGSYFSSLSLPRTLVHLSIELSENASWEAEYSKHLPPTLTSLECATGAKHNFFGAFKEIPSKVTRLSLPHTTNITIQDMAQNFPKTVVEVLLARHTKLSDTDLALIPRHWRVLKVLSLLVTGKTFPKDMVGKLSLADFNDSFARLLPPQMPPFWDFHPSVASPKADLCRLVTPEGGITLPPGITELDLLGVHLRNDALFALCNGPNMLKNLNCLKTENSSPPIRSSNACTDENDTLADQPLECDTTEMLNPFDGRPYLPASLKTFQSNALFFVVPMYTNPAVGIFPKALVSLHLPQKDYVVLSELPNLELLEVSTLHRTIDFSVLPRLHTLIMRNISGPYRLPKALPNTLTRLKIISGNYSIRVPMDLTLPPNLTSIQLPSSTVDLSHAIALSPTLAELELRTIKVHSAHLISLLPNSYPSASNRFIAIPGTDFSPEVSTLPLEGILNETQFEELKNRVSSRWLCLTHLSHSDLVPTVEEVLKSCFPGLIDLKFDVTADWGLEHLPFLPPKLDAFDLPLSIQKIVSQIGIGASSPSETQIGSSKAKFCFFSPSKGRMATSRVESAPLLAQLLFKTCYSALPATLTCLEFGSLQLSHWVPKLLPRTLTMLNCNSSHFNADSYRQLPPSLVALRIRTTGNFQAKHVTALPAGLKTLDIDCESLNDAVVGHLPRGLEYFACSRSWALGAPCLPLLPPHLKILLLPNHFRALAVKLNQIPASVIHLGPGLLDGYFSFSDGLLANFLGSLSENTRFLARYLAQAHC